MECLKLAWQSVCGKKRSSVLMSVILAISFAFAVITLSVSGSMIKTNDVFRKTTYGEWQLILPGITRAHRIAQCREMGIPVIEEPFTVREMMEADEIFFTSASALCCRIEEIDGQKVGGRAPEMLKALQDALVADYIEKTNV